MTAVLPTRAEGIFEDNDRADKAIADLQRAGFPEEKINVAERHEELTPAPALPSRVTAEGSVLGMMIGILLGIAAVTILVGLSPRLISLESMNLLFTVVVGALAGGLVGAILGAIVGFFTKRRGWKSRLEEIHRIVVTVQAGNRYNDAVRILRRHGAMGSGKPLV